MCARAQGVAAKWLANASRHVPRFERLTDIMQ